MRWIAHALTRLLIVVTAVFVTVPVTRAQSAGSGGQTGILPTWAYPVSPGVQATPPPDDGVLQHVTGSAEGYSKSYIANLFTVPDWFPESHPPMRGVVAHGRGPAVAACAYCHLPNGLGRPENASVAGLPERYMLRQLEDFKSGARKGSERSMGSVNFMIKIAKNATPEELLEGVAYFASLKPSPWIRVMEADVVPKTRISGYMLVLDEAGGTEPIGNRVIEIPENLEQTELRSSKSGFVAYVPAGSLKRGEALVKTGNGKTMACALCHGPALHGGGDVPSIAGRSPSQMARQIIDLQTGARNGAAAQAMKPVVSTLTLEDVVAITGYLASLKP